MANQIKEIPLDLTVGLATRYPDEVSPGAAEARGVWDQELGVLGPEPTPEVLSPTALEGVISAIPTPRGGAVLFRSWPHEHKEYVAGVGVVDWRLATPRFELAGTAPDYVLSMVTPRRALGASLQVETSRDAAVLRGYGGEAFVNRVTSDESGVAFGLCNDKSGSSLSFLTRVGGKSSDIAYAPYQTRALFPNPGGGCCVVGRGGHRTTDPVWSQSFTQVAKFEVVSGVLTQTGTITLPFVVASLGLSYQDACCLDATTALVVTRDDDAGYVAFGIVSVADGAVESVVGTKTTLYEGLGFALLQAERIGNDIVAVLRTDMGTTEFVLISKSGSQWGVVDSLSTTWPEPTHTTTGSFAAAGVALHTESDGTTAATLCWHVVYMGKPSLLVCDHDLRTGGSIPPRSWSLFPECALYGQPYVRRAPGNNEVVVPVARLDGSLLSLYSLRNEPSVWRGNALPTHPRVGLYRAVHALTLAVDEVEVWDHSGFIVTQEPPQFDGTHLLWNRDRLVDGDASVRTMSKIAHPTQIPVLVDSDSQKAYYSGGALRYLDGRETELLTNALHPTAEGTPGGVQVATVIEHRRYDAAGDAHRGFPQGPFLSDEYQASWRIPTAVADSGTVIHYQTLENGSPFAHAVRVEDEYHDPSGVPAGTERSAVPYIGMDGLAELPVWHCPNPTHMALMGGRMFATDGYRVYFSKRKVPGIDYEFVDEFSFPAPTGAGAVVSLVEFDGNLLLICENGVYAVGGQGPDATGGGVPFSTPRLVSRERTERNQGASVVRAPTTVAWLSASGFVEMVSGWQIRRMDEVRTPPGVVYQGLLLSDHAEVWWVPLRETVARALVWNYRLGRWSEVVLNRPRGAYVQGGALHYYSEQLGMVRLQRPSGALSSGYTRYRSRWFTPGGVGNEVVFDELRLEGIESATFEGDLIVQVYVDYKDQAGAYAGWTITPADRAAGQLGRVWRVSLKLGARCTALRVDLTKATGTCRPLQALCTITGEGLHASGASGTTK